jgi:hypothetical protein
MEARMAKCTATALLMWMFSSISALGSPITLHCEFVGGTWGATDVRKIDRILVDRENQVLDFRVSQTMGTSKPLRWVFETKGSDRIALHSAHDYVAAGGILFRLPYAIWIDLPNGIAVWQRGAGSNPVHVKWKCV